MNEKEYRIKKNTCWTLWITLGLGLTIPVFLLATLIGYNKIEPITLIFIIGLTWVIFDIGKTIIMLPPSSACKQTK